MTLRSTKMWPGVVFVLAVTVGCSSKPVQPLAALPVHELDIAALEPPPAPPPGPRPVVTPPVQHYQPAPPRPVNDHQEWYVTGNRVWRYIVLHHSASPSGNNRPHRASCRHARHSRHTIPRYSRSCRIAPTGSEVSGQRRKVCHSEAHCPDATHIGRSVYWRDRLPSKTSSLYPPGTQTPTRPRLACGRLRNQTDSGLQRTDRRQPRR